MTSNLVLFLCFGAQAAVYPFEPKIDTAALKFDSIELTTPLKVENVSSNCYQCSKQVVGTFDNDTTAEYYEINTRFPWVLTFTHALNPLESFTKEFRFTERGVYSISLSDNNAVLQDLEEGVDVNNPIYVALIVLMATGLIFAIGSKIYNSVMGIDEMEWSAAVPLRSRYDGMDSDSSLNESSKGFKDRIQSLDTFRGFSLAVMIFVNYGGGGYWFFAHSEWNGLTVADLVFPWFVFMMGSSMTLSFHAMRLKDKTLSHIMYKCIRRSLVLIALGLFLNNGHEFETWRIPGVLQRFGVAFFINSLIVLLSPQTDESLAVDSFVADVGNHLVEWALSISLIVLHTILTFSIDVPGCGRGYLGAGGRLSPGYEDCTGGAAGYLDKEIFGINHIYQHPTCTKGYECGPYDPEGLLGCLTCTFLCFLGIQAGRILLYYTSDFERLFRLVLWGIACGLVAVGLCGGSQNGGWIPINKNLWSLSFIFAQAGTGFISLAICYYLVDAKKVWNGAPFIYTGMNSIAIYFGSEVLANYFPFSYDHSTESHGPALAANLIGAGCWLLIGFYLHRIKLYFKV